MDRVLLVLAWLAMAGLACTRNDRVGGGEFTFELPAAKFSVSSDPNDPRWRLAPPEGIPDVICRGAAALTDDCCHAPAPAGSPAPTINVDCQLYPLSCDAAGFCALAFDYDDQATIDLGGSDDLPELSERRGWVLANADLAVIKTTINLPQGFPIESAALYVAPQGVLSHKAPASKLLSNIPLDQQKADKPSSVALDADARFLLSTFLADFNTPFTLILGVRVAIEAAHTQAERIDAELGPDAIQKATFTVSGSVRASF
jgi:hypothetical protein